MTTKTFLTNLKGDKGDKGDQGLQGLPGTNAVPADTAVAGYITTPGSSSTKTALESIYAHKSGVPINVMDFGAKGDGIADDYAAIAAAIASIPTARSATLNFPAGTYMTSAPIDLPYYITLQGAGMYSTQIITTSTTGDVLTATGKAYVTVREMTIGTSVTQTAGSALHFDTCTDVRFINVRLSNSYQLGTFTGTKQLIFNGIRVGGPTGTAKGFYFTSCVDVHCHDMFVNGGTTILGGNEAWLTVDSSCDTFELSSSGFNSSQGAGTGIRFQNTIAGGFAPRWVRLTNVTFEGGSGTAAKTSWRAAINVIDVKNLRIIGGYTSTSLYGIKIDGGTDMSFIGMNIQGSARNGAGVYGTAAPKGVTFIDCTFSDNSQDGTTAYSHLIIGSNAVDVKVISCYFGDRLLGYTLKATAAIEANAANVLMIGGTIENTTAKFAGTTLPRMFVVPQAVAATALGTLSGKVQVYDAAGVSLGFVPVYTTIT